MSDLIERLTDFCQDHIELDYDDVQKIVTEAAAEIERLTLEMLTLSNANIAHGLAHLRLRGQNTTLRGVLQTIHPKALEAIDRALKEDDNGD